MKRIIILITLVISLFLFFGCPFCKPVDEEFYIQSNISKEVVVINEEIEVSMYLLFDYNDKESWVCYIKNLPTETKENLTVTVGKKNKNFTEENFYFINTVSDSDRNYTASTKFYFTEAGTYTIYFGFFKVDENGKRDNNSEINNHKGITITVTN